MLSQHAEYLLHTTVFHLRRYSNLLYQTDSGHYQLEVFQSFYIHVNYRTHTLNEIHIMLRNVFWPLAKPMYLNYLVLEKLLLNIFNDCTETLQKLDFLKLQLFIYMAATLTSIWFFKSCIFVLVLFARQFPKVSFHSNAWSWICFMIGRRFTRIAPRSTYFAWSSRSVIMSSKKKNFSSNLCIWSFFCMYFSQERCLSKAHMCWYLCHL